MKIKIGALKKVISEAVRKGKYSYYVNLAASFIEEHDFAIDANIADDVGHEYAFQSGADTVEEDYRNLDTATLKSECEKEVKKRHNPALTTEELYDTVLEAMSIASEMVDEMSDDEDDDIEYEYDRRIIHGVDWRGVTYCDPKLDPPDGEWTSDKGGVTCRSCISKILYLDANPGINFDDDVVVDEGIIREETVRTSAGREYQGDREKMYKALVKFGTSNAEREAIISGQIPISSAALSFLKAQNVVKPVHVEKPEASHEKNGPKSRGSSFASVQDKFDRAVKKFAKNWEHFMAEMGDPDLTPDQAAPDAALGFFYDYPEWEKWSKTLGMSKATMKDVVADSVYSAMLKGQR